MGTSWVRVIKLMRARGENLMGEGIALNTVWVLEGGRGAKLCCC
jgi:hypothetical protein